MPCLELPQSGRAQRRRIPRIIAANSPNRARSIGEHFHARGLRLLCASPGTIRGSDSPSIPAGTAAIIGIRGIGTALSAVAAAGLSLRGWRVSRSTTRPHGHPYDRITEFNTEQRRWIHSHRGSLAEFLVVDEGPGLSGSSFLSAAEALEREGVPARRITVVGTREYDPAMLCARDAAGRWKRFRFRCTRSNSYNDRLGETWGGGRWRKELFDSESHWPASWLEMERLKFPAPEGSYLLKFDGFGRFGRQVRDRAAHLARTGFGPVASDYGDGLTRYEFVRGVPLQQSSASEEVLEKMAKYCAFRARACGSSLQTANSARADGVLQLSRGIGN